MQKLSFVIIFCAVVILIANSGDSQPQQRIETPTAPVSRKYIEQQFAIQDEMGRCIQKAKEMCGHLGKVDCSIMGESVSPREMAGH